MYTSEKNTNELTVRGGGSNPYGQPDRKISIFFLTTSLRKTEKLIFLMPILEIKTKKPVFSRKRAPEFWCPGTRTLVPPQKHTNDSNTSLVFQVNKYGTL